MFYMTRGIRTPRTWLFENGAHNVWHIIDQMKFHSLSFWELATIIFQLLFVNWHDGLRFSGQKVCFTDCSLQSIWYSTWDLHDSSTSLAAAVKLWPTGFLQKIIMNQILLSRWNTPRPGDRKKIYSHSTINHHPVSCSSAHDHKQ